MRLVIVLGFHPGPIDVENHISVSNEIICFEKLAVPMSGECNFYFCHVFISYCCVAGREESLTLHIC